MSKNNNFPMWGGNKWTKSMCKKYWWFGCVIIVVGYIMIVITANGSI